MRYNSVTCAGLNKGLPVTECIQTKLEFPPLKARKVEAEFAGGDVTSDGGVLLLRNIDKKLGLLENVNRAIPDPRDTRYIEHSQLSLLRQRVYALCQGYEDLNDHTELRVDPAIQTAVDRDEVLGSASTLCRLENRVSRKSAVDIHEILLNQFMNSFDSPPEELILDFDATDDRVHGEQMQRFFHGYYGDYCFLPLYVFCGDQLLVSYLRPSNIDGAKHSWAILALLTKQLRKKWPNVKIIFRGDSGFCRWKMLRWCDRHQVDYIVGIAKNARLKAKIATLITDAEKLYKETGTKARLFDEIHYKAGAWDKPRRVIAKAEHMSQGSNPRFIVTSLKGDARRLYEKLYCARGDMENRIKEQQLGLFADRTSCHDWWANQFRLLLSSLAYVLLESIRRLALSGTELSKAQVTTVRLKLLKVGAVIIQNTRRIRFLLSSAFPYQKLFADVAQALKPG